ncbi:MAG: tetratricopeptide repeat protein [Verrucomicrobiota bacterium]
MLLLFWAVCFHRGAGTDGIRFLTLDEILSRWRALPLAETQSAAEKGDLTAQHYLGYYHVTGLGGVTNETQGLHWYLKAAEKNFPNSLNNIGVLYLHGKSIKTDDATACQWLERAAQQGFPMAMRNLAELMRQDRYPRQKAPELRQLLEKAATTGDPEAQMQLGHYLSNPPAGGIHETQNAIYWYKKALAQGRHDACYHIGQALNIFSDTRKKELAALWYQRGADKGDVSSQAAVGWALFTGQGVRQDPEKGLKITLELAEKGHAGMMYTLGRYYADEGLPVRSPLPRDLPKAMMWYRKAAQAGQTSAMEMLGQHLLEDARDAATEQEGAKWLQQAAATGLSSAKTKLALLAETRPQLVPDGLPKIEERAYSARSEFMFILAKRYKNGNGVPQNETVAAFWTMIGNLTAYGTPWGGVTGLDEEGRLQPGLSDADRHFGELYLSLIQALRDQKPKFFAEAAPILEKAGETHPHYHVFATICYLQAGVHGDEQAKVKGAALQASLDAKLVKNVDTWMSWLKSDGDRLRRDFQK